MYFFSKEQCYKKIVDIENKLNSTREDAEESSRRHLTALWSAGNSTKKEFQKVWTAVNATNIGLLEKLREVKDNLTDQVNCISYYPGAIPSKGIPLKEIN